MDSATNVISVPLFCVGAAFPGSCWLVFTVVVGFLPPPFLFLPASLTCVASMSTMIVVKMMIRPDPVATATANIAIIMNMLD